MADEDEEIYDDGSSAAVQSPLNNLRSKFEQNNVTMNLNPALKPKPVPPAKNVTKFGGGGFLPGVVGNDKIPKLPVNGTVGKSNEHGTQNKSDSTTTVKDKEAAKEVLNKVLSKRDSVSKIADIFRANEESSHATPPKTTPKPKPPTPVRKTFDTNNNSKPNTKDIAKNFIPDSKESDKGPQNKMTGSVDKEKSSDTAFTTGSSGTKGLSILERQKLLENKLHPESKPGIKPLPSEKPAPSEKTKHPAGTGAAKFTIPKPKSQDKSLDFAVELRRKIVDSADPKKSLHRVSVKSVIRNFDAKKFKLAPREKDVGPVPEKPTALDVEVDWEDLIDEFQKIAQEKVPAGILRPKSNRSSSKHSMGIQELEEEEFYDDCGNMVPGERVSIIQPMTEEEELAELAEERKWRNACKEDNNDLPPPPTEEGFAQENYDDVATAMAAQENDDDAGELYEPLPDEDSDEPPPPVGPKPGEAQGAPELPPPPPPEPPRPNKDNKESEKERKKKEKEERERKQREEKEEKVRKIKEEKEERERKKRQEKEQKKKEQELKNMEKNFKISMSDLTKTVGQGTIKTTVTKVPKYNLAVQEGQKVEIIRMNEPNPKGKFLVRLIDSQAEHEYGTPYDPYELMGFVDSSNIEVDTGIIRRLMESGSEDTAGAAAAPNSTSGQDDGSVGEVYEYVEGEEEQDLIEEDIYEECT